MIRLLSELSRRNVFRVAAAYLVASWLVLQIVSSIETSANLPGWTDGMALVVLVVGFPIAMIVAWAFELTPEGMQKTAPADGDADIRPLGITDYVLVGLMVLVLGVIGYQMANRGDSRPDIQTADLFDHTAETISATPVGDTEEKTLFSVTPPALSVAVIPFVAMSSNENDSYFTDGLTEEILNSLAALPELLVTSRTSAFQFRGDNIPSIPDIAHQLGVAHIVEGSVRRAGNQVRITVQVIRAADDSHLWSQTYDRTMDDIFAIQEDIATNIAGALDVVLDENKRQLMREAGIQNVEAFIAYQRGVDLFLAAHDSDLAGRITLLAMADPYFTDATRQVPGFADAYLLQSDQFSHLMITAGISGDENQRMNHEEARTRYFELLDLARAATNDSGRKALINIDRILWSDNWTGANEILDEILQITGCPADNWLFSMVAVAGRAEEFIPYFERQTQCNPLSSFEWRLLSLIYSSAGQFDRGLEAIEHALDLSPDNGSANRSKAGLLIQTARRDELYALLDRRQEDHALYQIELAARRGDQDQILEILAVGGADGEALSTELTTLIPSLDPIDTLILLAQIGERDLANELARQRDASAASAFDLMRAVYNCRCGAPWDIEETPNFAARMAEAEFPWPPPGGGNFPLKDW